MKIQIHIWKSYDRKTMYPNATVCIQMYPEVQMYPDVSNGRFHSRWKLILRFIAVNCVMIFLKYSVGTLVRTLNASYELLKEIL